LNSLSASLLLAAAEAPPDLKLCRPNSVRSTPTFATEAKKYDLAVEYEIGLFGFFHFECQSNKNALLQTVFLAILEREYSETYVKSFF